MSSALACAGLAVSDEEGLGWLLNNACIGIREIGTFDGVHVGRWQDDSGATLILSLHDGEIVDFATTCTGSSGGLLTGDHTAVPVPGNIISGTVVLSAAIDSPRLDAAQA